MTRIVLLTGAPESRSIDWGKPGLLVDFTEPFSRFAGLSVSSDPNSASGSSFQPAWRSLPLERKHLATGHSQNHAFPKEYQAASFFNTYEIDSFVEEWTQPQIGDSQLTNSNSVLELLSQFYEKSYAAHEDIPSSQLEAATLSQSETSYISSFNSLSSSYGGTKVIPSAGYLTSLKDLPNSVYLDSIQPQTMTVNLIVGIIAMPAARTIQTRRGDVINLIEALVGDDTKSGFGINFWLPSSSATDGDLRDTLDGLRPQDIVLIRNVALSSFRQKVYGQSLRKDMTKAYLLYRNRIDKTDIGGCYTISDLTSPNTPHPQVEKTMRVREWVMKFVGGGVTQEKANGRVSRRVKDVLPPDTQ